MSGYVELHASSAFSFLRGASLPEDLVATASDLGLGRLAVLDRDGLYSAPQVHGFSRDQGLVAHVGAEITLADGSALPLLVRNRTGYENLCQLISRAKLTPRDASVTPAGMSPGEDPQNRKRPCFATWTELTEHADGLIALTGDEDGAVSRALSQGDLRSANETVARLKNIFGADNVCVEMQRRRIRGEDTQLRLLADLAEAQRLPLLATSGARHATPAGRIVADAFTCLRHHTTLDRAGRLLSENAERHLRSAAQMRALFSDYPQAVENTVRIADRLEFTLQNLGYTFPAFPVPDDETMDSYLRKTTFACAEKKFGRALTPSLRDKLQHELELICRLGFAGYFLIIWDICQWAREERGTLIQGRGSAANSAVCYVLGITAVNPLEHELLFERFLSEGRIGADGNPSWPDVDLDLPSGERREEVIQEIYKRYQPHGAAMVANVVTYRGRSTIREMGKVLGLPEDALNRFSALYANGDFPHTLQLEDQLRTAGLPREHPRFAALVALCRQVKGLPRHLGQHSGGMVLCPGKLNRVVPLEPASMEGRTIVQWDKDDCENLGLVKIDFLGLGMMAVLQECFELCARRPDGPKSFDELPRDDVATYDMICEAKTVGVFQIESRAQMSTLPRFRPRNLYDLAMQVAIVRPGPIVGNLVHPLIRRRKGEEPVDYIDPSLEPKLEPILRRTMGVILFQEQMIAIAMQLAGFTGGEAEELRRAMGFTKNTRRLDRIKAKLRDHLQARGHSPAVIDKIVEAVSAFAFYGFPESHAISFALLAYASSWLKRHRPAEFFACLLNNQPMGFYSPATLLQDARRYCGLKIHPVCVVKSEWGFSVESDGAIRIGLSYVRGLKEAAVRALLAERARKPIRSMNDFLARTQFSAAERRALAATGALNAFAPHRRAALWQVEAAWSADETLFRHAQEQTPDFFEGRSDGTAHADFPLKRMTLAERIAADFEGMSLTAGDHPMKLFRHALPEVTPANELIVEKDGQWVTIAGSVICRQRPGTAKGVVFVSLEDETGVANAIVTVRLFEEKRLVVTQEPALRISGKLQHKAGVAHVRAEKIEPLQLNALPVQASHDFH